MSQTRSQSGESRNVIQDKLGNEMTHNVPKKVDKYRVQLDFSGKAVEEVDQLKQIIGASSRADVIRNALRWLFWCAKQVSLGGTILLERDGKQREIVFPFVTTKVGHEAAGRSAASS